MFSFINPIRDLESKVKILEEKLKLSETKLNSNLHTKFHGNPSSATGTQGHCCYATISHPHSIGSTCGPYPYHLPCSHQSQPLPKQPATTATSTVTGLPTKAEFEAVKVVVNDMKMRLLQLEAKVVTHENVQPNSDYMEEALQNRVEEAEVNTQVENISVSSIDAEVDSNATDTPHPNIQLN